MTTLVVPLAAAGKYLHWGVINISLANLLIIGVMILVFVCALVIPFPADKSSDDSNETG
jgi:hypothetical protein